MRLTEGEAGFWFFEAGKEKERLSIFGATENGERPSCTGKNTAVWVNSCPTRTRFM